MHGIVMEIRNGRCVVLKDDGTFEDLSDRGYQVGQEITIQTKKSPVLRYAALAACLPPSFSTTQRPFRISITIPRIYRTPFRVSK